MRKYLLHVLIISFVFLLTPVIYAEEPRAIEIEPVLKNDAIDTERRIALVIGNGSYKSSPLRNPVNDAVDVASKLKRLGFDVTDGKDMTRKEMRSAIRAFGDNLKKGGVGLFYYSGHGMQVKGKNYLIPVGVDIQSEDEVEDEAIDAGLVMRKMERAGNTMNMVFLDACRDNPFARSFRTGSKGLAQMDAPSGSLIVYATAPGSVAADGKGRNGIFTKNLLLHLNTPGLEVGTMLRMVRVSVKKDTDGKQVPWESSSLEGEFYFVGTGDEIVSTPQKEVPQPPGGAGKLDFGDIRRLAEVKAQWAEWQKNLSAAYKEALKYDTNTHLAASEKVQVWKRLANSFSQNNPYSTEDQLIRSKAVERLKYWRNYKEPTPPVTPQQEPSYKTYSDGSIYEGTLVGGRMSGQGTQTWPDGKKYVGEFKSGKLHGQGTLTWPDGEKYVGEFKSGKHHGQGTLTWPNGDKYVGGFKNGIPTGGWFYRADGSKHWSYQDSAGYWVDQSEMGKKAPATEEPQVIRTSTPSFQNRFIRVTLQSISKSRNKRKVNLVLTLENILNKDLLLGLHHDAAGGIHSTLLDDQGIAWRLDKINGIMDIWTNRRNNKEKYSVFNPGAKNTIVMAFWSRKESNGTSFSFSADLFRFIRGSANRFSIGIPNMRLTQ